MLWEPVKVEKKVQQLLTTKSDCHRNPLIPPTDHHPLTQHPALHPPQTPHFFSTLTGSLSKQGPENFKLTFDHEIQILNVVFTKLSKSFNLSDNFLCAIWRKKMYLLSCLHSLVWTK